MIVAAASGVQAQMGEVLVERVAAPHEEGAAGSGSRAVPSHGPAAALMERWLSTGGRTSEEHQGESPPTGGRETGGWAQGSSELGIFASAPLVEAEVWLSHLA